jgi:ABC-type amino acid transport substrate-binding protein
MKNNSYIIAIALAALGIIAIVMAWSRYNTSSATKTQGITIGVASGYAPWATRNEAGELEGFDVEVATELARRLELPLELVDMSPEMLMASLRAHKIDCMVAPMAITPEREKAYNMVHYQGSAARQWPIMMRADVQIPVSCLEEFASDGRTLGVLSGTKQSEYALSIEGLAVHTYDGMPHILMALRAHKIDCALIDPDLGQQLSQDNPDMRCLLIDVPAIYQSLGNGIAVHKDNTALATSIQQAIESMKDDGFIQAAEERWHIGRLVS